MKVQVKMESDTVWLTQKQMAELFGCTPDNAGLHLKNIFKTAELNEKAVTEDFSVTASDGKTYIVKHYNLDAIISVGYRVNSVRGTQFRIWATKTLRQHIFKGYTINKNRIAENYQSFLKAVDEVKKLLPSSSAVDAGGTLELIKMFASTWFSLDAYDTSSLPQQGLTKKQVDFASHELETALQDLKKDLLKKKLTTNLFATERSQSALAGIVGNVFQSFDRLDLYSTIEEKAAHLLYFVVKNHPFIDGNKRSGAFSFIWFLKRAALLNTAKMTPEALTALTLLVAESKASEKERMIGLILMLLNKK